MSKFSTDYIVEQFKYVAGALKVLRLIFSGFGVAAIPIGQSWQTSSTVWKSASADYIFWGGIVAVIATGFILLLFEKDSVSLTIQLRETEEAVDDQERYIDYMHWREELLLSWQTVTKLLSELTDQALTIEPLTFENRRHIYTAVVEILANYKLSIFRIGEEYCNISLYQKSEATGLLECVSCYRSRPSDANVEHRKWKVGEGHVGKAYELQRELICGNANSPDVKPWISARPCNADEHDEERYVSLAAVPVAVNAETPSGVLIITSSEPMRFANSEENDGDEDTKEQRRLSVAAIQDFAAQVGQIMSVMELREIHAVKGSSSDGQQT